MRCLITGAAGFIGSHLCERLVKQGCQVSAFIHYNSRNDIGNLRFVSKKLLSKITIIKGDICDAFSVDKAVKGHDYIFHLAALIGIPYSYHAPASYVAINVNGTLNILEAARSHKVKKVIHTSTSEVYGTAVYVPIDENHPLQGQSPYSATKIAADQLAESYYRSFDVPVAIVRLFNTFGPRQSCRAVIPSIITQLVNKTRIVRIGSVFTVRDFNYIEDTINGFIKNFESKNSLGKVINIGSGKGYSIEDVFDKICDLMQINAKLDRDNKRIRPQKSEVANLVCNFSRAKKLINYKPVWRFEEGLKETIDFFRAYPDDYISGKIYCI